MSNLASKDIRIRLLDDSEGKKTATELINAYVEGGIIPGQGASQQYVDEQDSKTLEASKTYTDSETSELNTKIEEVEQSISEIVIPKVPRYSYGHSSTIGGLNFLGYNKDNMSIRLNQFDVNTGKSIGYDTVKVPLVNSSNPGFMHPDDKVKLDSINLTSINEQILALENELETETTQRTEADAQLNSKIDWIENYRNADQIVDTKAALNNLDKSSLNAGTLVEVKSDEDQEGITYFYELSEDKSQWLGVGPKMPYALEGDNEQLETDVQNLKDLTQGRNTPLVPKNVLTNLSPSNPSASRNLFTQVYNPNHPVYPKGYLEFVIAKSNSTTGKISELSAVVPFAGPGGAGVMTTPDKVKLDGLANIKTIGDNLTLADDGTLSATGGGGSNVNLLSRYTTTVEDNDAYSASYVNEKINGKGVAIGHLTQVGVNPSTICIGEGAGGPTAPSCPYGIAIGNSAHSYYSYSTAIGAFAVTARHNEVSFGGSPNHRSSYLSNVTDGELDTDAVNLSQLKAAKQKTWKPNTDYQVGELVLNENKLYEVTTAFTSGETFDSTNLSELGNSGGGSSVNILSAYKASPNNEDVYNSTYINSNLLSLYQPMSDLDTPSSKDVYGASFIDSRIFKTSTIQFGKNSSSNWTTPNIALLGSSSGQYNIAIGSESYAVSSHAIAIGYKAGKTNNTGYENSISLGDYSVPTRANELSIGSGSTEDEYGTRYIGNVKAGTLDTDAVNLKQMQDYVAEHAVGGSSTDSRLTDDGAAKANNLPDYVLRGFNPAEQQEDGSIKLSITGSNLDDGTSMNTSTNIPLATSSQTGLLSSSDKQKLSRVPQTVVSASGIRQTSDDKKTSILVKYKNVLTGEAYDDVVEIPTVSSQYNGLMSPEQNTKLSDLANIKTIGTNLTLSDDGTLSASGGSSVLDSKWVAGNTQEPSSTNPIVTFGTTGSDSDKRRTMYVGFIDPSTGNPVNKNQGTLPIADQTTSGLMSGPDKAKLDSIDTSKLITSTSSKKIITGTSNLTINANANGYSGETFPSNTFTSAPVVFLQATLPSNNSASIGDIPRPEFEPADITSSGFKIQYHNFQTGSVSWNGSSENKITVQYIAIGE